MRPAWKLFVGTLLFVGLSGCWDRPATFYLFGPSKSCFPASDASKCTKLMVYDQLVLRVVPEKQEVVFVQKGLHLDETNTLFKRLENCKVVDRETFSCDGLTRTDGRFTNTEVFKNRVLSSSYWTFVTSSYVVSSHSKKTIERFHDNDTWLGPLIWIAIGLVALGGLAALSER